LKKHGKLQKKILFVVTDGETMASREITGQAVRRLQEKTVPRSMPSEYWARNGNAVPSARSNHGERTGGIAFFPPLWTKLTPSAPRSPRHTKSVHHWLQAHDTEIGWWIPQHQVDAKATDTQLDRKNPHWLTYAGQEQATGGGN